MLPEDPRGVNVYISSELFGRTFPWRINSSLPTIVIIEQLVVSLGLPKQIDHEARVGIRFHYQLAFGNQPLASDQSLTAQGVKENCLLWLLTEVLPFAGGVSLSGDLGHGLFRNSAPSWVTAPLVTRAQALGLGR